MFCGSKISLVSLGTLGDGYRGKSSLELLNFVIVPCMHPHIQMDVMNVKSEGQKQFKHTFHSPNCFLHSMHHVIQNKPPCSEINSEQRQNHIALSRCSAGPHSSGKPVIFNTVNHKRATERARGVRKPKVCKQTQCSKAKKKATCSST